MKSGQFLRTLSIVHLFFVVGLVVFAIIAYWQLETFVTQIDGNDTLLYIVPVVALIGYFGSQFVFKQALKAIPKTDAIDTKLAKYKTATILKFALIEGAAILALIAFHGSGIVLYFVIGICLIAYLIVQKPNYERLKNDMALSLAETEQIDTFQN
ncbi:MAG: hypothetical protein WBM83_15740 [Flavobacteriaceae bacterium]